MSIYDLFSMAIKAMVKRKLRTFLTVFGVVLGTASITLMISLGIGVNTAFDEVIEQMGSEALRIHIWANSWDPSPFDPILDDEMVARIQEHPNVVIATPMLNTFLTFRQGRYEASLSITGIKPEAMPLLGFNVVEGENLNHSEELHIVFGGNAPLEFRNERNRDQWMWGWGGGGGGVAATIDLLGGRMQASFDNFSGGGRPLLIQPVGLLSADSWDTSNSHFMPLAQVQEIELARERAQRQQGGGGVIMWGGMNQTEGYQQVQVLADHANNVDAIVEHINSLGIENAFSNTQWINVQRESTAMLQGLLAGVGFIVLVVAAISIANTMIMSIYERTREIGIMKVIGASVKDIRRLFLIEAALIGALGGAIGLVLSFGASHFINNEGLDFLGGMLWLGDSSTVQSVIPLWLYVLAFSFSSTIGLIFGFWPAHRATKISALSAIKTE